MVIHIEFDIKITDHDGMVLHSAENRFDENIPTDLKQGTATVLGIDFTDFLAEYLSSSGFFLREKLMKGRSSRKSNRHIYNQSIMENVSSDEYDDNNLLDRLKGSELEYKIRIGNNKVLIGKIPLKLDTDGNPEQEQNIISASLVAEEPVDYEKFANSDGAGSYQKTIVSEESTSDGVAETSASTGSEQTNSSKSSVNSEESNEAESFVSDEESKNSESPDKDKEPAIFNFLNYSMMRAIEKYEDNIYNVWYEDSTDMEPVIDE